MADFRAYGASSSTWPGRETLPWTHPTAVGGLDDGDDMTTNTDVFHVLKELSFAASDHEDAASLKAVLDIDRFKGNPDVEEFAKSLHPILVQIARNQVDLMKQAAETKRAMKAIGAALTDLEKQVP